MVPISDPLLYSNLIISLYLAINLSETPPSPLYLYFVCLQEAV